MLHVLADKREAGILDYNSDKKEFIFNNTQNNPVHRLFIDKKSGSRV